MIYIKNLRAPFVLKILNSLKKVGKQEVSLNFITCKLKKMEQDRESVIIKQSNCFYHKPVQLSFHNSVLFRRIDYPYKEILFNSYQKSSFSYSIRHYSKKPFFYDVNSKTSIILILCGFTGIAVYWVLYSNNLKKTTESAPTIIVQTKPLKIPESPELIPDRIPYLIIGGGTAAFAAFRAIKSSDPTAKVLVISNELYYPYMRPPLSKELIFNKSNEDEYSKFIFNQWNGKKRSVFFEPEEFYMSCEELALSENGGVSVARGWNVKQLDHDNKLVKLDGGKTIKYDKCLLATGSVPKQLPVLSKHEPELFEKVLYYRSLNDFSRLENAIKDNSKSVVVVGGGFSGTELACSLARKGVQVNLLFKEENILTDVLPGYLAKSLTAKIEQEGINIINNSEIEQVKLKDNKVCLKTVNGREVTTDLVIVALGVTPNTELAVEAGLEVDQNLGGYITNSEFQVRRDLYAAGDCASFYDIKCGRRRIEHHDHAVISGRLAGENMTGKGKTFKLQSMFWTDIAPQLGFEAVGIVDSTLPTVAVYVQDPETETINKPQPSEIKKQDTGAEFERGIIFYLQNKTVVGVVLWNLYNRISIARRVLKSDSAFEDFYEVAKHFRIDGLKFDGQALTL